MSGPGDRMIAVRNGIMVSSACFMVGATTICEVVDVSMIRKYAWMNSANMVLAAPRATIKYSLLIRRLQIRRFSYRPGPP